MGTFNYQFSAVALLLLIIAESSSNINHDKSSLLTLKSHITSDPYNVLRNNWTIETSVCSWIGVTCDSGNNRVTGLDISNMGLQGTIPPEIGNLSSLVSLDMGENLFHGLLPASIFNMSSLQVLSFRNNSLSGSLPKDMCSGHSNLPRWLRVLRLSYNKFDGEIPSSLGQCSHLEHISLAYNNFVGYVPGGIGNLSSLVDLFMYENLLHGPVPTSIFNISSLQVVSFWNNSLSGNLPVDMCNNNNLPKLRELYLSYNKFDGEIPSSLGQCSQLELISFSNNGFVGNVPSEIGNLSSLARLFMHNNLLHGTIPSTIGNLSELINLDLHSNKIRGEIPPSLCNLRSIGYLHLSHNSLEGSIPHCLGNLSKYNLYALHLKENLFHGLIPATFTEGCLLTSLNLNGNKLEGALPKSLVHCRNLQVLDVGNNEIEETFPIWMETLPILRVLVLRSNRFNGTILLDSNTTTVPFPSLQVFDISHNEFTGTLPARYLENFVSMINVKENKAEEDNWFLFYQESMEFVLKGVELSIARILITFTSIDMSDNRFFGAIPQSIGKLNSLRYLNLSCNNITGNIPASLGNMSILESLDLSSNRLVGEIPLQLTRLTSLSILNLSFNNLDGQIPQSSTGQFPTFDNNSYMGNSGLCGFPLTKKCKRDDVQTLVPVLPHGDDDDSGFIDGFSWRSVALGYGSGFVFGTTIGYFIFRYERPKWFVGLFFNVQDKINYRSKKRTNAVRRRRT